MGLYFDNKMLKEYENLEKRVEILKKKNQELIKLIMDVIYEMKSESVESTVEWGITLEKELDKI